MGRQFTYTFPNMSFVPNEDGVNETNRDSISRGIWSSMEIAGFRVVETDDPESPTSVNSATRVLLEATPAVDEFCVEQPWRIYMRVEGQYTLSGTQFKNTGLIMKVGRADLLPDLRETTHEPTLLEFPIVPQLLLNNGGSVLTETTGPRVGSVDDYPALGGNREMTFYLTTTNRGIALSVGMTTTTNSLTRWAIVVIQRPVDEFSQIAIIPTRPLVMFTNVTPKDMRANTTQPGNYPGPTNKWFVQTLCSSFSHLPTPTWENVPQHNNDDGTLLYDTQVSKSRVEDYLYATPLSWSSPVVTDVQQYLMVFPSDFQIGDTVTQYELDLIGISKATVFYETQYVEPVVFNENRGYMAVASNYEDEENPIIVFHLQSSPDIF